MSAKFQNIMNSAAHLIHGSNKFCHVTPLSKEFHWLPVQLRINFKILCLTFKALNGLATKYLAEQINCYKPTRSLRSSEKSYSLSQRFTLLLTHHSIIPCLRPLSNLLFWLLSISTQDPLFTSAYSMCK